MGLESEFLEGVAARNAVRLRVVGIVVRSGQLLVQRPADDPDACYALPGGEYEVGDTFVSRLRTEIEEETTARLVDAEHLFVVENRFTHGDVLVHSLEHHLLAEIDRSEVESREAHLTFQWLPIERISEYDLRPIVVRDTIAAGECASFRHLEVPHQEPGEPG